MSNQPEPDCGSSSCIFSAKGGMRTNGPCRCYENAGFHGSAVMAAKQMLREVLLLRGRLDAMPRDRTWTKDKPTPGEWWLSLAPEKRPKKYPAVLRVRIVADGDMYLRDALGIAWTSWPDSAFEGAQWMPANDPADPFAEQPRDNSRDGDLP